MTTSTTSQQIHTLLAQLENHAFTQPMLFAKPLTQVTFDYTPTSIDKLNQLFAHFTKKGYTLGALLQQQGGTIFFLSIAAYLANYLAKNTDEPIVWLNYTEALTEINKKNREYGTDFQLEKDFDNSLVAKIGDGMFCRPLQAVRATLAGEGSLGEFIDEMQAHIFERAFIDVADDPDSVCQRYLAKLRTGRVRDTTIAFFDDIHAIDFDFSEKSLHEMDAALSQIHQTHHLNAQNYLEKINDPGIQALCYVLGFYLGVTTAQLAKRPVHWASFSQAKTLLQQADFYYSLEHSFVMVSENHYHTPMLAISNALFCFTDYPYPSEFVQKFIMDTQDEFAHPTADSLQWFVFNKQTTELSADTATAIPKSWQMAMNLAGRLLAHDLLAIFDGGELSPNLYEINVETKKASIRTLENSHKNAEIKALEQLYQVLNDNPNNLPLLVASYASQLQLTTGKVPAIVLEIRVYQEPKLALQLMLPYREAGSAEGFALFSLAYLSQNTFAKQQPQAHKILTARLPTLIDRLYHALAQVPSPLHTGSFLDNYYLPVLPTHNAQAIVNNRQKSPLVDTEENMPAEQITLTLLEPIAIQPETIAAENTEIEQNITVQNPILSNAITHNEQTDVVQEPFLQKPLSQQVSQDHFSHTSAEPKQGFIQNSNGQTDLNSPTTLPTNVAKIPSSEKSLQAEPATVTQPAQMNIATTDAKTKAELLAKLRQDQARLQSELSTSDQSKDKKLLYIGMAVVVVIMAMIMMSKLMK